MTNENKGVIEINSSEQQRERVKRLFQEWNKRLHHGATVHFATATKLKQKDRFWSISNLIFAIFVLFLSGTSGAEEIFISSSSREGFVYDALSLVAEFSVVLVPVFSLLVVLTAAFQYVSQFGSRAAQHNGTAVEYANLRRKMERFWTKHQIHEEAVHSISRSYNTIARFAPIAPESLWQNLKPDTDRVSGDVSARLFDEIDLPK